VLIQNVEGHGVVSFGEVQRQNRKLHKCFTLQIQEKEFGGLFRWCLAFG
jgi:hypothetical protein